MVSDHMTGDLHPHGQNSPDIPMSLCSNFFHTPIPLPKGHRMAGSETTHKVVIEWGPLDTRLRKACENLGFARMTFQFKLA